MTLRIQVFGLIILLLLIIIWRAEVRDRMLASTIDGHAYNVLEYLDNPYAAANKLALINKYVHKLNKSLLPRFSTATFLNYIFYIFFNFTCI